MNEEAAFQQLEEESRRGDVDREFDGMSHLDAVEEVNAPHIVPEPAKVAKSSTALSTLETSAETPKSAPFQRLLSGTLTGSCDFDVDTCTYSNTGSYSWTRDASGTGSYGTGPSSDHTSGWGYYMYTEASGNSNTFIYSFTYSSIHPFQ